MRFFSFNLHVNAVVVHFDGDYDIIAEQTGG